MDIQMEFGLRCKQLRARSGMSQEELASRAGLDRTYISSVERGQRNISLSSMEKIASAFHVSLGYLFSEERLSDKPAYQQQDFAVPLSERFKHHLDESNRILSFRIAGLLNEEDTEHMIRTWRTISAQLGDRELRLFYDYRAMKASDCEPAVFSQDIVEKAVRFQNKLTENIKQVVVLCNSEYMVHQMNYVSSASNHPDRSIHLYGNDKDMVGNAYRLLGIRDNGLIRTVI